MSSHLREHQGMAAGRRFATTRWSLVLDARDGESHDSNEALAELCESYWFPLYAFVRRQGHHADDAADLTQAYFAKLLEKDYLQDVRPEAGRFRSFSSPPSSTFYTTNGIDRKLRRGVVMFRRSRWMPSSQKTATESSL